MTTRRARRNEVKRVEKKDEVEERCYNTAAL
jgi:hypothetical protein